MIFKKILCNVVCISSLATFIAANPVSNASAAQSTDKAYCTEYFDGWWKYDGVAQFNPSYKVPKNPGYDLETGKYVKQSYVNFTRKKLKINGWSISYEDASVIGGRSYSPKASSNKVNATYKATATATDSLNVLTNQTRFWYGWLYF